MGLTGVAVSPLWGLGVSYNETWTLWDQSANQHRFLDSNCRQIRSGYFSYPAGSMIFLIKILEFPHSGLFWGLFGLLHPYKGLYDTGEPRGMPMDSAMGATLWKKGSQQVSWAHACGKL